jgi:hypothetical protein
MAYPTTIAFQPTTPFVGCQPIGTTSTTQNHPFGTIVRAVDPVYGEGEFIYAKGVASTAPGDLCTINTKTGATVRSVAAVRGLVGVAMSANVASQYGWYQIAGVAVVTSGTVLTGTLVYVTATPGSIDDAVVSADKVDGALTVTASGTPAAGYTTVQLSRPCCNGNG